MSRASLKPLSDCESDFESGNAKELAERLVDVAQHPEAAQARVQRASALYREHQWENEKRLYLDRYRPA